MAWNTKDLTVATPAQAAAALQSADTKGYVTAVVTVRESQYVPADVRVRARLSPWEFEGILRTSTLGRVRADTKVADVSHVRAQEFGW